jgi:UDP-N-acetyl-D-galactosamine dehydrogenase
MVAVTMVDILKTTNMKQIRIGVIGLGYVGLPLARLFSTKFPTIGYDLSQRRVDALMAGHDNTLEVSDEQLRDALDNHHLRCTTNLDDIRDCNFYVVAVPTPVDKNNAPDLSPLYGASETVGKVISQGDIVVYESTVYPGVTEDECIPVVERTSGLKYNVDFFAGYSPERINPGDKVHTVEKIVKITSGSTPEVAEIIDSVYQAVLQNGTHKAPSIKVAEAAKVIENSQRDINIAFVNELSKIFTLMGIDTHDVLEAAGTKWNFIKMNPGLVGGHCISVDPYYLAQCAQHLGYNPEIILAGRRMNDGMGAYVADQTIKLMLKKGIQVLDSKIIIMGFTFKENCPDVRNTRVIDIYRSLTEYHVNITVYDPWANPEVVKREYGINIVDKLPANKYDAAIVAVGHRQFREMEIDFNSLLNANHVIYDVKAILPRELVDGRL